MEFHKYYLRDHSLNCELTKAVCIIEIDTSWWNLGKQKLSMYHLSL